MTENTTMGRVLALRLAATDDPANVRQMIQDHLSAYDADDGRLILATALETITTVIVHQAVDESDSPGAYRAQFTTAADQIAVGPTEQEK